MFNWVDVKCHKPRNNDFYQKHSRVVPFLSHQYVPKATQNHEDKRQHVYIFPPGVLLGMARVSALPYQIKPEYHVKNVTELSRISFPPTSETTIAD